MDVVRARLHARRLARPRAVGGGRPKSLPRSERHSTDIPTKATRTCQRCVRGMNCIRAQRMYEGTSVYFSQRFAGTSRSAHETSLNSFTTGCGFICRTATWSTTSHSGKKNHGSGADNFGSSSSSHLSFLAKRPHLRPVCRPSPTTASKFRRNAGITPGKRGAW